MKHTLVVTAFLAAAFSAGARGAARADAYTVIDLGTVGGAVFNARGLNELGQVAGWADVAEGRRAFVRNADGTFQNLGLVPGFGLSTTAWDINNAGQVSGRAFDLSVAAGGTGNSVGYRFDPAGGGPTGIPAFGVPGGNAYGINEIGQVVGNARLPSGDFSRAFITSPTGGSPVHLGTLFPDASGFGGFLGGSYATGVNNRGAVVGSSGLTDVHSIDHGFLWTAAGGMVDLGTLSGFDTSYAQGINDAGLIVGGVSSSTTAASRPALWRQGMGWSNLGTLGGDTGFALNVNASGKIVGYSATAGGRTHAFLHDNDALIDLNSVLPADSGWELAQAYDINSRGFISGVGTFNGQPRAFLLTPNAIPEPGTLALLAITLLPGAVAALRRRRQQVVLGASPAEGMVDLGTLGGSGGSIRANAVNDLGHVNATTTRATLWQNGVLLQARAINDAGQIARKRCA